MPRLNFKKKVERQYNNNITEILKNFVNREFTYMEVSEETGFTVTTVHKWFKRYSLNLDCNFIQETNDEDFYAARIGFKSLTMNKINMLSKEWV